MFRVFSILFVFESIVRAIGPASRTYTQARWQQGKCGVRKPQRNQLSFLPPHAVVSPSYSCPKPTVSSTAHVSFCVSWSRDLYGGRSRRLKHVCDLGSCASSPDFSIVKRRGPSEPWRSLKPLTGIREVPVANCKRRDFCSASQLRMTCSYKR